MIHNYFIEQNEHSFLCPAGTYWIGDPCYPFPDVGEHSGEWDRALAVTDFFSEPYYNAVDCQVLAFATVYGDGEYQGNDGKSYLVDSGLIGIMTENTVKYLGVSLTHLEKLGHFVTFDEPFQVIYDDGVFSFGDITIDSNEEEDD